MELKIPVLALVDSDPYGLKILAVYMKGAQAEPKPLTLSVDSAVSPACRW